MARPMPGTRYLESFSSAGRLEHRKPPCPENPGRKFSHRRLIIYDEHYRTFTRPRERLVRILLRQLGDRQARQVNPKSASFVWLGEQTDMPALLGHDAVAGRQPKTRTVGSPFLCREERFEDLLRDLLRHSRPGIADGDHDVIIWHYFSTARRELISRRNVSRRNRQRAAIGHCLLSVAGKVH